MKLFSFICLFPMIALCGTLNVKQVYNLASTKANGFATARSSDKIVQKNYKIFGKLNKDEVGHCRIFVVSAVNTRIDSVTHITEWWSSSSSVGNVTVRNSGSAEYDFHKSKHNGAFFVPQSIRVIDIDPEATSYSFSYTTPKCVFHTEKWNYIGDTSNGVTFNGISVYLLKEIDGKITLLKKFSNCAIKDPIERYNVKIVNKVIVNPPNWLLSEFERFNAGKNENFNDIDFSTCDIVSDK